MTQICQNLKISNKEIALVRLAFQCKHLVENKNHSSNSLVDWAYFYAHPDAQIVMESHAAVFLSETREWILMQHQLRQNSLQSSIARIKTQTPLVSANLLKRKGFLKVN